MNIGEQVWPDPVGAAGRVRQMGKRTGSNPDSTHRSDPYVIGKNGASAAITLVERTSRFTTILALPERKNSAGVADALIEHTNGLIREYLPKGEVIPAHQPYLTSIAEELNERPRAALGFLTPRESFERLLLGKSPVATTA